jgi:hypothetical protein
MKTVALWSVVCLAVGVGSAQTDSLRSPSVQRGLELARLHLAGGAQAKPGQAIPAAAMTPAPSAGATNTQPNAADKLLQVKPSPSFLEEIPQLAFAQPKANEVAVGRLTLSGIAVQVIKAKNPLELLNPVAPAQYGSGTDNVEWFAGSCTGPLLKLFSINF